MLCLVNVLHEKISTDSPRMQRFQDNLGGCMGKLNWENQTAGLMGCRKDVWIAGIWVCYFNVFEKGHWIMAWIFPWWS